MSAKCTPSISCLHACTPSCAVRVLQYYIKNVVYSSRPRAEVDGQAILIDNKNKLKVCGPPLRLGIGLGALCPSCLPESRPANGMRVLRLLAMWRSRPPPPLNTPCSCRY